MLLVKANILAASRGFARMTIIIDPNASRFYERMGCEKVTDVLSNISGRTIPEYFPIPGQH